MPAIIPATGSDLADLLGALNTADTALREVYRKLADDPDRARARDRPPGAAREEGRAVTPGRNLVGRMRDLVEHLRHLRRWIWSLIGAALIIWPPLTCRI